MPQQDPFASHQRSLTSLATQHFAITPADGVDLPTRPRVLRVLSSGTLALRDRDGVSLTYEFSAGETLMISPQRGGRHRHHGNRCRVALMLSLGLGLGLPALSPRFAASRVEVSSADPGALAFWDLSLAGACYQELSAPLSPAGDGDPLGRLDDLSGNGHHLFAASGSSRPTLRAVSGAAWLENRPGPGKGVRTSTDLSVSMVVLALQYDDPGPDALASSYPTLMTDQHGITAVEGNRIFLSQGTRDHHHPSLYDVSVSAGSFSDTVSPLPWSVIMIRRDDWLPFAFSNICGPNAGYDARTWPGRFAPVAVFDRLLDPAEMAQVHDWAQRSLGVA